MRWKQDYKTGKLIPIDKTGLRRYSTSAVIGSTYFEPFISPVDNSLVRNVRELRNHNARNDVVDCREYNPEYFAKAARKRRDFFDGKRSLKETQKRKTEIREIVNMLKN